MRLRDVWHDEFEVPMDKTDYLWGRAADMLLGAMLAGLLAGLVYILVRHFYG